MKNHIKMVHKSGREEKNDERVRLSMCTIRKYRSNADV